MIKFIKYKLNLLINDSKFKEVLHGSFYSLSAKIFSTLLGLFSSIIIARYYGAKVMGLLALVMTIISISELFSTIGLSTAILRLIPEYKEKFSKSISLKLYKKILNIVLVSSIVVALFILGFSNIIAIDIFHKNELLPFLSLIAIVIIFDTIKQINISTIRALKIIKVYVLFEFLPKLFSLSFLLILTFLFYDKNNPIYVALAIPILIFLLTVYYLNTYILSNDDSNISYHDKLPSSLDIVKLSLPMFLTSGLSLIIAQTDIVMIGIFKNTELVGIYNVSFSLAMLTNFILNSVNMMAAPKFAELYHANKMEELKYVAQKSSKLMFFATLPIVIILLVFGKFILNIYGEVFTDGYLVLVFLIIGQFINAASGSVGYLLNMTGYQKEFRNIILIAASMNIILNFILLPKYGINGAAFASLCSVAFWNIVSILYIKRKFGFTVAYIPKYIIK